MGFNDGPGFTAYYGYGIYGQNVYSLVAGPTNTGVTPTGIYNIQNGYCPLYLRFQFSGINLGLYVFDLNPSTYMPFPQRTTQQYQTILDFNPTVDESYQKIELNMTWDQMPEKMWTAMLPYSRKNVDGTSENLYFWDGTIGRCRETSVKIESLRGEIRAGWDPIDRFSVSLKMRLV